jgi:hypothetical protein
VVINSLGALTLQNNFDNEQCRELAATHRRGQKDGVLKAVLAILRKRGQLWNENQFLLYDCRDSFHEDFSTLKAAEDWNHSGLHPANCQRLMSKPAFQPLMQTLRRDIAELHGNLSEGRAICIVFYCKSGRDRSVGMTRIARQVLRRFQQEWEVTTEHMCRATWRRSGAACMQRECIPCTANRELELPENFAWEPLH